MGLLMRRHRQPPQPPQPPKTESEKIHPVTEKAYYKAMKKEELLALAKAEGLSVPDGATKKDLLSLLEG